MKLFPVSPLAKAVALTLPFALMAGCSNNDKAETAPTNGPAVSFNLEKGQVPYPNDLTSLVDNTTLQSPRLFSEQETTPELFPNSYWNYLSSQDGWGTSMPITLPFDNASAPVTLNSKTLQAGVHLYRENQGDLEALQWGIDFQAKVINNTTLAIEPLKPFAEHTRYVLALTQHLKDQRSASIRTPESYKLLLDSDSEAGEHLQSLYQMLSSELSSDHIAYAADFTTATGMSLLNKVVDNYLKEVNPIFHDTEELTTEQTLNRYQDFIKQTSESDPVEIETKIVVQKVSGHDIDKSELTATPPELNFRVLETTLTLPYYLDTPTYENCTWHPNMVGKIDSIKNSISNDKLIAPEDHCRAAFSYWQNDQGQPVTFSNADELKKFSDKDIKALVILPKDKTPGPDGFPTIIYMHGVTSQKESILSIADQITAKGYALIAIDQPMHNSRGIKFKYNRFQYLTINATGNLLDYVLPTNVLTTKGYMSQAILDNLGLRMAINNVLNDPEQLNPLLDSNNVHLMGISLGAIAATSEAAVLNSAQERHPDIDRLSINTASLSVPGASVVTINLHSPALKNKIIRNIKKSAPFRLYLAEHQGLYTPHPTDTNKERIAALDRLTSYEKMLKDGNPTTLDVINDAVASVQQPEPDEHQRDESTENQFIINALNVLREFKRLKNDEEYYSSDLKAYEEFQREAWQSFADQGEYIIQSVLDPVDPINHARTLANSSDFPVLLMEVVGDGSNRLAPLKFVGAAKQPDFIDNPELTVWNPGDFVVPNKIQNRPQGGTDPLIRALGLDIIDSSQTDKGVALRAAVRYSYGNHGSLIKPTDLSHISTDLMPYDQDVHESMIKGILSFMDSQGQSIELSSESAIDGKPILKPSNTFPAQPE